MGKAHQLTIAGALKDIKIPHEKKAPTDTYPELSFAHCQRASFILIEDTCP
ncbi:MAG: hypothetical protein WD883_01350 [Candidatus Colwellbacteria bacterium]